MEGGDSKKRTKLQTKMANARHGLSTPPCPTNVAVIKVEVQSGYSWTRVGTSDWGIQFQDLRRQAGSECWAGCRSRGAGRTGWGRGCRPGPSPRATSPPRGWGRRPGAPAAAGPLANGRWTVAEQRPLRAELGQDHEALEEEKTRQKKHRKGKQQKEMQLLTKSKQKKRAKNTFAPTILIQLVTINQCPPHFILGTPNSGCRWAGIFSLAGS